MSRSPGESSVRDTPPESLPDADVVIVGTGFGKAYVCLPARCDEIAQGGYRGFALAGTLQDTAA